MAFITTQYQLLSLYILYLFTFVITYGVAY